MNKLSHKDKIINYSLLLGNIVIIIILGFILLNWSL